MSMKVFSVNLIIAILGQVLIPSVCLCNERARDLGIEFDGTPGHHNAITDVPGVSVGYSTISKDLLNSILKCNTWADKS